MDKDLTPPKLQIPHEQGENDKTQVHLIFNKRKIARKLSFMSKDYYVYFAEYIINESGDLLNFKEVIKVENLFEWLKVMNDETDSIRNNGVWELTNLPQRRKVIGCKWILKKIV